MKAFLIVALGVAFIPATALAEAADGNAGDSGISAFTAFSYASMRDGRIGRILDEERTRRMELEAARHWSVREPLYPVASGGESR